MLCLDQVSQLREIHSDLVELNSRLYIIGSGTAEQANTTREQLDAPFRFLVDSERVSYRAASMRKDVGSTVNIRTLPAIVRAWKKGHRQKKLQGDAFQQGGVLIIRPDDSIAFHYISKFGGDHPDPQQILECLEKNPT